MKKLEWKYVSMEDYWKRVKKTKPVSKFPSAIHWMCAIYPENAEFIWNQHIETQEWKAKHYLGNQL